MSVVFESNIKVNDEGNWYIELIDTAGDERVVCDSTQAYEEAFKNLSEPYGGMIDEVRWSKSENLRPDHFDEIRLWMSKLQQETSQEEGGNN